MRSVAVICVWVIVWFVQLKCNVGGTYPIYILKSFTLSSHWVFHIWLPRDNMRGASMKMQRVTDSALAWQWNITVDCMGVDPTRRSVQHYLVLAVTFICANRYASL